MDYCGTNDARSKGVFVLLAMILTFGGALIAPPVFAQQRIQALVCSAAARITIQTPASDSVVGNPDVVISGVVTQANQIEVSIDGNFDSTVPLDVAAKNYTTTLHLAPGTHVIQAKAIDACQIGNPIAQVVVTYQPISQASTGSQIQTGLGGVVVNTPTAAMQSAGQASLPSVAIKPLMELGEILDLNTHPTAAASSNIPHVARLILVGVGAAILIFLQALQASYMGRWLQAVATRLGLQPITGSKLLILLCGGVMIGLGFVL